jgi:hypothetical protein
MDLGAVARDQAGVFVPAQAHACGLSTYQVRRRRAVGEFVPALGSALAFAGAPIVAESLDWAAYLSAGSDAVMSGASAAARHRIKVVGPRPCVTVPVRRHLQLEGVTLLRDDLPDDDVDFVAGAAVTSLPRTVVDCLALAGDRQALALLDRALQRHWITVQMLVAHVRSRTGTGPFFASPGRTYTMDPMTSSRQSGQLSPAWGLGAFLDREFWWDRAVDCTIPPEIGIFVLTRPGRGDYISSRRRAPPSGIGSQLGRWRASYMTSYTILSASKARSSAGSSRGSTPRAPV